MQGGKLNIKNEYGEVLLSFIEHDLNSEPIRHFLYILHQSLSGISENFS
jgi:hypothetical protein